MYGLQNWTLCLAFRGVSRLGCLSLFTCLSHDVSALTRFERAANSRLMRLANSLMAMKYTLVRWYSQVRAKL